MSDWYVGEIRMFTRAAVPIGWHLCDGALLPITENEVLYALLGTTYGGDGVRNFGIPDLRGRVVVGQGSGVGLTPRPLASTGGSEGVTLNMTNMPPHSHIVNAAATTGTSGNPTNKMWASTGEQTFKQYSSDAPDTTMGTQALGPASIGSGNPWPHDNVMPSLPISFIIALNGLFPQQT